MGANPDATQRRWRVVADERVQGDVWMARRGTQLTADDRRTSIRAMLAGRPSYPTECHEGLLMTRVTDSRRLLMKSQCARLTLRPITIVIVAEFAIAPHRL